MSDTSIDLRKTLCAGNTPKESARQKRTTLYESHAMNLKNLEAEFIQTISSIQQHIGELKDKHLMAKKGRRADIKQAIANLRKELEQEHDQQDKDFTEHLTQLAQDQDNVKEQYQTQRNIIEQNMEASRLVAIKELFEQSTVDYESLNTPDEKTAESIDILEAILARLARIIEIARKDDQYYEQSLDLQKKIQPILAKRLKQITHTYL